MAVTVNIETADGDMALYDAPPEGSPKGGVVVLQEAFGVDDHVEEVTRRFAEAGYRSVAPHLFHRTGDPIFDYYSFEKAVPHMRHLTEAFLLADFDATFAYFASLGIPISQVGVVGFCMGGSAAFVAAARRKFGAAVTFYGGGVATDGRFGMPPLVELAPDLKTPWLGLFGDRDESIPVAHVEQLRDAVAKAPVPQEIVRYAEAGHGFYYDQSHPRYFHHAPSATDGWQRTLSWLDTYFAAS